MRFSHRLSYDAAASDVHEMLADPAFRAQVCAAVRAVRHHVEVDTSSEDMTVVVDQALPAHGIPSFAKKIVGDEIQVVQRETWHGTRWADLSVEIPGKPAQFTGTLTLAEDGQGTVETVAGEVKVRIPMVGAKLEGLISDMLTAAFDAEQRVGKRWLADQR